MSDPCHGQKGETEVQDGIKRFAHERKENTSSLDYLE